MLDVHAVVSVRGDDIGSRVYIYLKNVHIVLRTSLMNCFQQILVIVYISIVKTAKVRKIIKL